MGYVRAIWKVIRWPIYAVAIILGGLFLYHLAMYPQKSRSTVAAIESQRITEADVDGVNLPPAPDPGMVDATVAGVDANANGIRDDVELALFEKYPNDRKVRAAALQYAKAEQLFLTSVFNTPTWKAVAEISGRANLCVADVSADYKSAISVTDYIESAIINTAEREESYEKALNFITSYGAQSGTPCDIK